MQGVCGTPDVARDQRGQAGGGVDILRIGALSNTVVAPALPARSLPNLPSQDLGWLCQVPKALPAFP